MKKSSNSETKTWWIDKNGKKYGPMTQAELKARVVEGDVSWQHLARAEGTQGWKPIASLNIFSAAAYDAPEAPTVGRWTGERNDDSLLFSPTKIVSGELDRTPRVSSGVLDMRSLRAAYEAKREEQVATPPAPVFAGEAFDVSASLLLPHRRVRNKPSRLVYGLAGVACALTMTSAALAAVAFGKTAGEPLATGAVTHALIATATAPAVQPPSEPPPTTAPDVTTPKRITADAPVALPPARVAEPVKKHTRKTITPKVTKTTRRTPKVKTPKATTAKWDEYACLLAADPPPACSVYAGAKAPPKEPKVTTPDPNLPQSVSRTQISSAMRKLDYRVERCAELVPGAGLVKVKVKVAPNGSVTGVSTTSSPDPKLSSCIKTAVGKASFPKTQTGASFAWAFPLR